jgi:hypothetical protein
VCATVCATPHPPSALKKDMEDSISTLFFVSRFWFKVCIYVKKLGIGCVDICLGTLKFCIGLLLWLDRLKFGLISIVLTLINVESSKPMKTFSKSTYQLIHWAENKHFQVCAPTGEWKKTVGIAAVGIALGIWGYMWCKKFGEPFWRTHIYFFSSVGKFKSEFFIYSWGGRQSFMKVLFTLRN